jgi:putative ABC transport system substrate-binding protein
VEKDLTAAVRAVIVAVVFVLAAVGDAQAQQPVKSLPRIGFISSTGTPDSPSPLFEAFRQGLRDLDYVDGKNIVIVHRFAEGRLDRMPAFVREFVDQKVDVIIGVNNVVIRAAKDATKTIPIVLVTTTVDPVSAGYVKSFAHPGENITGLANLSRELSAKRVELLREVLPKLSRVAILWDADGPGPSVARKEYEAASRAFKLEVKSLDVRGPKPDIAAAFNAAKTARSEALIVVSNALLYQHAAEIFDLATKQRLPSMTEEARFVDAGGLMSYGANIADLYRRAAGYVVDIIKGAKPGDLPIRLPEKFEFGVNLKTARHLDIVLPQRVLIQADKVVK